MITRYGPAEVHHPSTTFVVSRQTPNGVQFWSKKHGLWIDDGYPFSVRPSRFRTRETAEHEAAYINKLQPVKDQS